VRYLAKRQRRQTAPGKVLPLQMGAPAREEAIPETLRELQARVKIPILLKHYLSLGGHILGLNVDPAFNNSIDCLFFIDLQEAANSATLSRYVS
jgi:putative hemolysin